MATLEHDLSETLITLTSDIVAAHVSNNSVGVDESPTLIQNVYGALAGLGGRPRRPKPSREPAVSIRASVKHDHIVCLEDGKKMKMLKRHLMTDHGLTPDEYRARWGLAADYPMVAPDYAEKRRDLAKKIGLGRKPGQRRGRRKKTRRLKPRRAVVNAPRPLPIVAGRFASGSARARILHQADRSRSALRRARPADHRATPGDRARAVGSRGPSRRRGAARARRGDRPEDLDRHRLPHRAPVRRSRHSRPPRFRRWPRALRSRARGASRSPDRRRDRQSHRIRRSRARGAAAADRREARLPPRRPPDGALRRPHRPRRIDLRRLARIRPLARASRSAA